MTIQQIMRERAEALLTRFHSETMPPFAAVPSLAEPNIHLVQPNGAVQALPGHDPRDAAIWRYPDKHRSSLWVSQPYGKYREAYCDFVALVYGIPKPVIPQGIDIDHIRNRARVAPTYMIRVEAVDGGVNRSHGAGFESKSGRSPVTKARLAGGGKMNSMDYVAAIKLAGLRSLLATPGQGADRRMEAAVDYLVQNGWDEGLVRQALENLQSVAARR